MVGPEGDLKGDKIELYLDETGRGLQRLEAYTKVMFLTVTPKGARRRGTGERLTYFAKEERYVMSGPLAHVAEQMPQECRETTGRTLTFFKATDSITVDGNEEVRTQTKSGSHVSGANSIMATLRTRELTKSYGGRTVVRGISLEVNSGEVVGLLGPNGAGKTTTFYMVVGLTTPDSGRVELDGTDLTSDPMYVRARKGIAYLPQEALDFPGTDGRAEHPRDSRNARPQRRATPHAAARAARGARPRAPGEIEGLYAVGRRAAARRNYARAGDFAVVRAARRALRGDRSRSR